tara:strand:- start:2482 stop:3021 length:540 start_codon:yes stop_codon:yes gene_type:complete
MSNKGEECMELKNIKYKTMLQHNKAIQSNLPSSDNISQFLEKEKKINSKKPWTRLQKSVKLDKLQIFANDYSKQKELTKTQSKLLIDFLISSLEKKKLQRTKDIVYDSKTGKIKSIPGLSVNKTSNKFTLKRVDKKKETLKNSLAPIRKKKKKKHQTSKSTKKPPKILKKNKGKLIENI